MGNNEFMELKQMLLESQERQAAVEKDLEKALSAIAFMQEILANLLIQTQGFEDEEGPDALPPALAESFIRELN